MGISKIAKEVILDELKEQTHPELVEDVIFWALKAYAQNHPEPSWGKIISHSIISRIEEAEQAYQEQNN